MDILQNINVEVSGSNQDFNSEWKVCVFDINKIKGLEFEAAFFLDIDVFAKKHPTTFHKYLYVGTSRAATFLGITCKDRKLPKQLQDVQYLFKDRF